MFLLESLTIDIAIIYYKVSSIAEYQKLLKILQLHSEFDTEIVNFIITLEASIGIQHIDVENNCQFKIRLEKENSPLSIEEISEKVKNYILTKLKE